MTSFLVRGIPAKLAAELSGLRRVTAHLQRMRVSSRCGGQALRRGNKSVSGSVVNWRDSQTFSLAKYGTQAPPDPEKSVNDPDVFGNVSRVSNFRESRSRADVVPVRELAKKLDVASSEAKFRPVASSSSHYSSDPTRRPDLADPADSFGTLDTGVVTCDDPALTADDPDEEEPIIKRRRLHFTASGYGRDMLRLIEERKLGEALALLKRMTEVDHIKPDAYVYTILINGCGRSGYTAAAFRLYNKMKERNLKIYQSVYVGLFNACSNSPWPEDGLARARKLYTEVVVQKGLLLNNRTYHAMIKAFGRCGDLSMALGLADQMVEKQVAVSTETFNFLLSACATDRQTGFLHAIMMWRKMREKRVRPDIFSYNLLLRTVHDCGLGDPDVAQDMLLHPTAKLPDSRPPMKPLRDMLDPKPETQAPAPALEGGKLTGKDENSDFALMSPPLVPRLPDLLSPRCVAHDVVTLHKVNKAVDRLLMLGGMSGLLERMSRDHVQPDRKTFTQLIETIPATRDDETQLLDAAKSRGVALDVDFFNVLIKKRNTRDDAEGAKGVLDLIAAHNLHIDIATFGALAIGCSNMHEARNFLISMEEAGFRPNVQILGCLIKNACRRHDYWFLLDIMKRVKTEAIRPDPKMLTEMERCVAKTKRYMVEQEKMGKRFEPSHSLSKSFRAFLMSYKTWLKELEVQMPDHPWSAYKLPPEDEDEIRRGRDRQRVPNNT